jgi:hypothetical protein
LRSPGGGLDGSRWALIATLVGLLIEQVASRLPGGGSIVARIAGYGWSLASLFAIPILALEDCSPTDCLKRSGAMVKECWGEGVAGTVIITAWTTIAILLLGVAAAVAIPCRGQHGSDDLRRLLRRTGAGRDLGRAERRAPNLRGRPLPLCHHRNRRGPIHRGRLPRTVHPQAGTVPLLLGITSSPRAMEARPTTLNAP